MNVIVDRVSSLFLLASLAQSSFSIAVIFAGKIRSKFSSINLLITTNYSTFFGGASLYFFYHDYFIYYYFCRPLDTFLIIFRLALDLQILQLVLFYFLNPYSEKKNA